MSVRFGNERRIGLIEMKCFDGGIDDGDFFESEKEEL